MYHRLEKHLNFSTTNTEHRNFRHEMDIFESSHTSCPERNASKENKMENASYREDLRLSKMADEW